MDWRVGRFTYQLFLSFVLIKTFSPFLFFTFMICMVGRCYPHLLVSQLLVLVSIQVLVAMRTLARNEQVHQIVLIKLLSLLASIIHQWILNLRPDGYVVVDLMKEKDILASSHHIGWAVYLRTLYWLRSLIVSLVGQSCLFMSKMWNLYGFLLWQSSSFRFIISYTCFHLHWLKKESKFSFSSGSGIFKQCQPG